MTIRIYGQTVRAPLETGAIPNLISLQCAQQLGARIEANNAAIRAASGAALREVGIIRDVPIALDDLVVPLSFVVLKSTVFGVLLETPTLVELKARMDLVRQEVALE